MCIRDSCLSTNVGGIPSIIHDGENGKLFPPNDDPANYGEYIKDLFADYAQYQELAYASFNAYESRLNWRVAGQKVKELLAEII